MKNIKIQVKESLGKKRYYISSINKEIHLTDKETGIIACLIDGLRPKEIAWQLTTSLNTVNTHLANIKIKLGCISIFQLGMVLGTLMATEENFFTNNN